jgi:cytochrome c peroxidase
MKLIINILLLMLVFISSCKKEESKSVEPGLTSYNFSTPNYFGDYKIPLDNPTTIEGVELGRMLFYETKLSGNNSMSCSSCHVQSSAFTDTNQFSVGIDGVKGTRNSMSISNVLWQSKFFWDGRAKSLEEQALDPIENPIELHQTLIAAVAKLQATSNYPSMFKKVFGSEIITSGNIAKAIAQFERTLISKDSKFDKYLRGEELLTPSELRGRALFFTHPSPENALRGGNCGDCHTGDLTGNGAFHNNGLDDVFTDIGLEAITNNIYDKGKFKTPSLRNIGFTSPYMHDGRFKTLNEVLDHYNEHVKSSLTLDPLMSATNTLNAKSLELTAQEKQDIIDFLNTLNDETFVTNSKFSNPFK